MWAYEHFPIRDEGLAVLKVDRASSTPGAKLGHCLPAFELPWFLLSLLPVPSSRARLPSTPLLPSVCAILDRIIIRDNSAQALDGVGL